MDYMQSAVWQAKQGYRTGLPIGSVLVFEDQIIGVGHNRRIQDDDPIAHAEQTCLRNAGILAPETYRRSVLYSTLTPCWMCAGTVRLYGIPKVIVADLGEGVEGRDEWRADEAFYESAGIEFVYQKDEPMRELFRDFIE
ncbi:MAG: nucleoside deaminase, partial [Planctomycetota bacterium]